MPIAVIILIAVLIYCLVWLIIAALPYVVVGLTIIIAVSLYRQHKGL